MLWRISHWKNCGHNTYFDTANKCCFHEQKSARCLCATRAFVCETHTLARGARPDAFALSTRGDAKDGRSVASRVDAIGVADAIFAETGRPGTRFSRESGFGAADVGSNIEKSVAAPRRLSTMTCLAPSRAKNSGMTPPGADSNLVMSALPATGGAIGSRPSCVLSASVRAGDGKIAPSTTAMARVLAAWLLSKK